MKIVFVSPEIAPFVKTGGLADVAGALPGFVSNDEFEVIAVMPCFRSLDRNAWSTEFICNIDIPWADGVEKAAVFMTRMPASGVRVYFIDYAPFFDRDGLYGERGMDYEDNDRRFAFFCRAVLETCRAVNFRPDVIHCNDWQTGIIPVYLKTLYCSDRFFQGTSVLFTVHNLAYQGLFDPENVINATGLPWSVYDMYGVEYYGRFGFLKGGLFYSDFLTTVSPRYSSEIREPEYGMGLHGLLQNRVDSLAGIINGIDYDIWNPGTDLLIRGNYKVDDTGNKKINTVWLCRFCGFEYDERVPVMGMITRLTEQKGIDILASAFDELMKREMKFVLLGTGDEYYHGLFSDFAKKYSRKMSVILRYDEELAHMIYAGSDMFLMPSKFEPCGLSQLVSLKYGTVPVVRETGGLADTITDFSTPAWEENNRPNGFMFRDYSPDALLACVDRALKVYEDREMWHSLMINAMNCDFSWSASAEQYRELYRKLFRMKDNLI